MTFSEETNSGKKSLGEEALKNGTHRKVQGFHASNPKRHRQSPPAWDPAICVPLSATLLQPSNATIHVEFGVNSGEKGQSIGPYNRVWRILNGALHHVGIFLVEILSHFMLSGKRGSVGDPGESEGTCGHVKKNRVEIGSSAFEILPHRELIMATSYEDVEIDEDLHSRQLAVYGRETMRRLFGAHVLVSGLQGLGVEIGEIKLLAWFCLK